MSAEPEPHFDPLPLDAWHRGHGARMVPFAGYAMPIHYEGIIAEHLWTRGHAGLFDVSHMGQLLLTGDGVDLALETVLPGDIVGLKPNRARYSLLLADDGGIIDDLMVTRLPVPPPFFPNKQSPRPFVPSEVEGRVSTSLDTNGGGGAFYMVVNGATKEGDIAHLRAALPGVAIDHRTDWALLALQGPEASDALARVAPGVETLAFMEAGVFPIAGTSAWISRSGYTGEDGYEISLPADAARRVADALLGQPEVRPIGLGARDSLRLEAGLPLYGHDLDTNTNPAEAGLAFAIPKRRRTEGGFPGAATILSHLAEGPPAKRVGLAIDGRLPAREGATIHDGGVQVGVVTSGGFGPSVGAPIAMGYVAARHAAPGTALEIEVRGKRLAATVVPMPFVPHRYVRQGAPR